MSAIKQHWPWLLGAALVLVLLWMLSPILAPFALGAGLAYIGDPLVHRLQRLGMSRTLAVCLVFVAIVVGTALFLLLVIPPLEQQIGLLIASIPDGLRWLQDTALPYLGLSLPDGMHLDASGLRQFIAQHWGGAGNVARAVWDKVSTSGGMVFTTAVNLALIPVVSFYLLRDWDRLIDTVRELIPPRLRPRIGGLMKEADDVLGAFFRGQLLVMLALGLIYSVGLSIIGLKLALVIGLGAGLVSFVPYMGFVLGFVAATIAMLVQTGELLPLVWVSLVFAVGQIAEGMFLTPNLVGHRIGLHPVAVIFAVMAGGTLFGFVGVLLALPGAAVIAVMLRHVDARWRHSRLYQGEAPAADFDPGPE